MILKCVMTLFESITGSNMTIHQPGQILALFIRRQRYKWLLALGACSWLQAASYGTTVVARRAARTRTTRDGHRAFVEGVLVRVVGKKTRNWVTVTVEGGRNWPSSWALVHSAVQKF